MRSALLTTALALACQIAPAQAQSGPAAAEFPWDLSRHSCIFQKDVLIVGASVSAGLPASPIDPLIIAAKEKGEVAGQIKNVAFPGVSSAKGLPKILAADVASLGTVFAIDLFFWDSFDSACENSLNRVATLLEWSESHSIDVILGNIPVQSAKQKCGEALNAAIKACENQTHCHLIDADTAMKSLALSPIKVGDKEYTKSDLLTGIHLKEKGAIVFAELISKALDTKPPHCL